MKNLKQQFIGSVDKNFCPGADKHNYKKQGYATIKIFSYSYRKGLINFGCNLANFLKNEYNIKFLKEIKEEHIKGFFKAKGEISTVRTLRQYKSYLMVFDKLITQTYHIKLHFDKMDISIAKGEKLRDATMIEKILDEIIEENKLGDSESVLGLRICKLFGLRAEEVVYLKAKDFNLDKMVLEVHKAKNNRYREVKIDSEQKYNLAQEIRMKFDDFDRLVNIQADSLNKFLYRKILNKNIVEYKNHKTGIHSIRKMVAQREHKKNLENGKTEKESLQEISELLGHNKNRNKINNFTEDAYIYPRKEK